MSVIGWGWGVVRQFAGVMVFLSFLWVSATLGIALAICEARGKQ